MSDAAMPEEQDTFAESPELHERIDRVGYALLGGATVMFFLGFPPVAQYIALVAGQARIAGFDLPAATSPLVQ